jgi:MprA protease rhombosortase-interaction domain-containing protein
MKTLIALTAGLVVASSLASHGQSITWDLGGNAGYGLSTGQSLNFTKSGVKVTASAWSYTKGSSNSALEASKLGQWNPQGLGVINNEESNSSPWHQVDNYKQNDYVLFVFDTLVDVSSVRIQASPGPYDLDVSYWVGNITSSNLDNVTYTGLISRGFGAEQVNNGSYTSNSRDVSIISPGSGVNAILFGAKRGVITDAHSKDLDAFKIRSISATVIPEPSAALLTVLGALGFCLRRRR